MPKPDIILDTKMKINKKYKYFWYGVLASIFGSIHAPLIKYVTRDISPATFIILRYVLTALITLPFFFIHYKKVTKQNLRFAILSGVFLAISTLSFVMAINISTASYITLLTLLEPIALVLSSVILTKERINMRHLSNFSLAGLGALIIVSAPIISTGNLNSNFYPLATLLALIMAVCYPLCIIHSKKSNESRKKLPFLSIIFIQSIIVISLNLIVALVFDFTNLNKLNLSNPKILLPIIYSGIVISIINRALNVISYQKIGSAANGAIWYFGTLLTLITSVIFLNESISIIALLGGCLILLAITSLNKSIAKNKFVRPKEKQNFT